MLPVILDAVIEIVVSIRCFYRRRTLMGFGSTPDITKQNITKEDGGILYKFMDAHEG